MENKQVIKAINWNAIEDAIDKATWEKLTEQFWLDTRIPLSNDLDDWRKLSQKERDLVAKVFGGLTLLDTLQSEVGVVRLKEYSRTPHEEAVLANIEFMECYSGEHELLTFEGWKNIKDIRVGDYVLAYNKELDKTLFEKVMNTSSHTPSHILRLGGRHSYVRVSPGHRVLYERSNVRTGKDRWSHGFTTEVVEAKDFHNVPKTYDRRIPVVRDFYSEEGKVGLTPFERLLIAFQADGSIGARELRRIEKYMTKDESLITDTFCIKFTFTKARKQERLAFLCDSLSDRGVKLVELAPTREKHNYAVYIPFTFIDSLGTLKGKTFLNWFSLNDFDSAKAKDFIDEIAHWDSYKHEEVSTGVVSYISYYSVNKANVDFVSAVATLAGYTTRVGCSPDNRKPQYSDVHHVRVLFESRKNLHLTGVSVVEEDAEVVYGVEVPSSFLVVRNGVSTMISGNCVHAKSYSSIFSTLNTKSEIEEIFHWVETNEFLQRKAQLVKDIYLGEDKYKKQIASVFLESFLFYSGFFTPLWYLGNNKLPNVAEIIKLIIRDESVHGTYIGYKFQVGFNELSEEEQDSLREWMYDFLYQLYENEVEYTKYLYDEVGWTEEVIKFLEYNANKALMNLGQDPLFATSDADVNPIIMNGISTGTSNHDFFSQVGNGYLLGQVEPMSDDDYSYGL